MAGRSQAFCRGLVQIGLLTCIGAAYFAGPAYAREMDSSRVPDNKPVTVMCGSTIGDLQVLPTPTTMSSPEISIQVQLKLEDLRREAGSEVITMLPRSLSGTLTLAMNVGDSTPGNAEQRAANSAPYKIDIKLQGEAFTSAAIVYGNGSLAGDAWEAAPGLYRLSVTDLRLTIPGWGPCRVLTPTERQNVRVTVLADDATAGVGLESPTFWVMIGGVGGLLLLTFVAVKLPGRRRPAGSAGDDASGPVSR